MTSSPDPLRTTLASYDRGSEEYAAHSQDRQPLAHLHECFAALVGPRSLVLDLGSGPAHDAAELARRDLRALACDPTLGLLKAGGHDVLRGRLTVGDARQLPFTDRCLEGVWACASLLHLPKVEVPLALSEAFRVLLPGGILFTSMQHGKGEMVPYDPGGGLPLRHYFFYGAAEWEALVQGAGFEVIHQRVNHTDQGVTAHADGWIETFARKPE